MMTAVILICVIGGVWSVVAAINSAFQNERGFTMFCRALAGLLLSIPFIIILRAVS